MPRRLSALILSLLAIAGDAGGRADCRVAPILCAVLGAGLVASTADPPRLQDYPVTDIFRGRPADPVLSTKDARMFRTQLRRQAALGPNFAGHYTLALWGCGAGCANGAVIDARSGHVWFVPFSFEDVWEDGYIVCSHGSDFEIASDLLIVQGRVNPGGTSGRHYFRWRNGRFTLVYHEPECST